MKEHEWEDVREDLIVDYNRDNYYSELKDAEILKERIMMLKDLGFNPTEFFSREYIRKHVLKQTDEEVDKIKAEMRQEYINNDNLFKKMGGDAGELGDDDFGGGGFDAVGGDFGDLGGDELGGAGDEFEVGEPTGAATDIEDEDDSIPEIDIDNL